MRIYVPATTTLLRALLETGQLRTRPVAASSSGGSDDADTPAVTAFAVTPALREWYVDDDAEELEYAAMAEAARGSLRLLDADPTAARRRAVVAADVADGAVTIRDDLERGVVQVAAALPMSALASVHIDDGDAETVVAAAASAVLEADLGDERAQDAVDDAEGFELSWYATQEIAGLLEG